MSSLVKAAGVTYTVSSKWPLSLQAERDIFV